MAMSHCNNVSVISSSHDLSLGLGRSDSRQTFLHRPQDRPGNTTLSLGYNLELQASPVNNDGWANVDMVWRFVGPTIVPVGQRRANYNQSAQSATEFCVGWLELALTLAQSSAANASTPGP